MKLAFWKRKKSTDAEQVEPVQSNSKSFTYDEIGIIYSYTPNAKTDADFYWESLEEEELAYRIDDHFVLPWEELFQLQQDSEHENVIHLLNLPTPSSFRPIIRSEGGLSDPDFRIILDGWLNENNIKVKSLIHRVGALLTINGAEYLLNEPTFQLVEKIKEFSRTENKDTKQNQKYWANIRKLANKSNANLDDFLRKTVVLAPEKLQLNLRKNLISQESVVEVQPEFDEAPSNWLKTFDQYNNVQDQYYISLADGGIAHVVIEPQVKQVLNEIKKMPNRRISGERAQAFLHNPFAQLGDDAIEVISPESFEESKQQAEIYTYTVQIEKNYDELNHYISAKLELQENSEAEKNPIILELYNLDQTYYFIQAYEKTAPVFVWAGYEIDRSSYLDHQIQELKNDLNLIQKYQDELQAQKVLDLSNYSGRVIGIGEAEKLNSEFIKRDSGESEWLPQHLMDLERQLQDENFDETIELLEHRIKQAEQNSQDEVEIPYTDKEVSLDDAKNLLDCLYASKKEEPKKILEESNANSQKKKKDTLLIANNIDEAEFTRQRVNRLLFDENNPPVARLPTSFRSQEFSLKQHQEYGIAWLQNLHQYAPEQVSGCLLADDMGLGKTLQLLCFIGEYLENAEDKKPVLIVAPVSLLENWEKLK